MINIISKLDEQHTGNSGSRVSSVITLMAGIHNTKGRMPAFLTLETSKIWLDQELSYQERKVTLDPVPNEFLDTYPINKVGDEEEYSGLIKIC